MQHAIDWLIFSGAMMVLPLAGAAYVAGLVQRERRLDDALLREVERARMSAASLLRVVDREVRR